jgi:DNA-binding response OmpR family regulator
LADRDPDTLQKYGQYLKNSGMEVDEASDGRVALAKALTSWHDVLVTETELPGMNGYELCEVIRHDPATTRMAIVVVTGGGYVADLKRARQAGADTILVKPCLPEALLAEIQKAIARSKELRQHSDSARSKAAQRAPSQKIPATIRTGTRHALSHTFSRHDTITPPMQPPSLLCPTCDRPLFYQRSHIGGVSERSPEQWDYYECLEGCGTFQYRQRTKKRRKVR